MPDTVTADDLEVDVLPRCAYCGWPTLVGNTVCYGHSDLPPLDPGLPDYVLHEDTAS